jgi:tRNA dimethylallyltransferase
MLVVLGPTASGKTALAVRLAAGCNGEIISADSRQVYRGMDIGTGKDLSEYTFRGERIPFHLIDIVDPGYEYNVYEYKRDFLTAYNDIVSRGKEPILCGGTGLYLDAVLRGYTMRKAAYGKETIEMLSEKSDEELKKLLLSLRTQHNTTDLTDRSRMIRAILIGLAEEAKEPVSDFPDFSGSRVIGIQIDRSELRNRITARLKSRLDEGMIDEVKVLLGKGLTPDQIRFYGLEYKFCMMYLQGEVTFDELFSRLNTAIHQFAKRQMTWFRRMEKMGIKIEWTDASSVSLM